MIVLMGTIIFTIMKVQIKTLILLPISISLQALAFEMVYKRHFYFFNILCIISVCDVQENDFLLDSMN